VVDDDNYQLRNKGPNDAEGAHTGLYGCTFNSATNKSPEKSFMGIMMYPSIHGKTFIDSKYIASSN